MIEFNKRNRIKFLAFLIALRFLNLLKNFK